MLSLEKYKQLEEAWEYQDFITSQMLKMGVSINAYQSREWQMQHGESASGIEIKNDRRMAETGNIYIEFNQTTMRGTTNKDSGIHQKDESWLYIIGDYEKFYIFSKYQLCRFLTKVQEHQDAYKRYGVSIRQHIEDGAPTSTGLVIPAWYVEEKGLAIRKVETNEKR